MGLLLSILFSYVGAVEMMFLVRDMVHQVGLHHDQMKFNRRSSSKSISSSGSSAHALNDLQQVIRKSIELTHERLCESDTVQSMVDGVRYENGYRIPIADENDTAKRWLKARANVAIESGDDGQLKHMNRNENAYDHIVVNEMAGDLNRRSEDIYSDGDSLRSSSLSVETVIDTNEATGLHNTSNHNDENNNKLSSQNVNDKNGKALAAFLDEPNDKMPQNLHFDECSKGKTAQKPDAFHRRRSEDIDGQTDNPWGELKPDKFHNADLWKQKHAMSISENDEILTISNESAYREQFERNAENIIGDHENEESYYEGEDASNESDVSTNVQIQFTECVSHVKDVKGRTDSSASRRHQISSQSFIAYIN